MKEACEVYFIHSWGSLSTVEERMLPQFHLPNWFIFRSVFRMQTLTKIYTYCISLCFLEEKMDKVKKCWVCQSHFIWKTLFLWHFTSSLVLTLSMPSLPHSSLNFEGRVLMETPQLGLSVLMSLIFCTLSSCRSPR